MIPHQSTTGSQYFANDQNFDTPHSKPSPDGLCNPKSRQREPEKLLRHANWQRIGETEVAR
jgi:hypothetical protein